MTRTRGKQGKNEKGKANNECLRIRQTKEEVIDFGEESSEGGVDFL